MVPNTEISTQQLEAVTNLLSIILANQVTLYTKIRKFHWNLNKESFIELHKLFIRLYTELELSIDKTAEHTGTLGVKTIGTMEEFLKLTSIKEHPNKYPTSTQMIEELLENNETMILELRKAITLCLEKHKDISTANFLTSLKLSHEATTWTLKKYLN